MLKKKYKLNSREIKNFFSSRLYKKENNFFTVFILENKKINLRFSKYALIVKKKIIKKAHKRNFIKRVFFNYLKKNPLERETSFIFILKKPDFQEKDIKDFF